MQHLNCDKLCRTAEQRRKIADDNDIADDKGTKAKGTDTLTHAYIQFEVGKWVGLQVQMLLGFRDSTDTSWDKSLNL